MDAPPQKSISSHFVHALLRYPYVLLAIITFSALGRPFLHKFNGDWDVTYLPEAKNLWHGRSIYHQGDGYIYPPFPALFSLMFTYLPGILPKLAWYAVTVACFIFLCRWAWCLAGGPPLQGRQMAKPIEQVAFILALIPGATYAFNCISHSQTDILIGFWILAGCVAFIRGRSLLAATLFGLAAAMKGPALIWFPYLIARRKPLAAGWMLLVFVGVNLVPNLVRPSDRHSLLLNDWAHDYLLPKQTANVYPDVWFSESNQSVLGCVTRWTTTRWEWRGPTYEQRIPLKQPASPATVKAITLSIYAVLAIILATVLGWWPRPLDRTPGSMRPGLEFSLVAILMLAFSPMAAKAQWGILMLPGFCVARLCITRRNPGLIFCFIFGWLAWLSSQNFLGRNGVFVGLWYGAVLANALIWFVGCAIALIRRTPLASPASSSV
jgi:hypothetical protein